jgi:acyl-CoA synthetase (NDP forming)
MTSITAQRLTTLFRPRSVALVGASEKSAFSRGVYANLTGFGFGEHVYLVNQRGAETHGRSTVRSCQEIGQPVDVAFLMVPQSGTNEALSDAAAAGIRNAVVLSSGYGEAGEAGRRAEAELVAHAESLDIALLGPNMLGFANLVDGVPVTSIRNLPAEPGSVALLSQSGASSAAMVDFAAMAGVGLSYMVTLGNEAMITAGHVLDFLVEDEHTRAIAMFIETIRDPEMFRRAAARATHAGKAVVVLKAGSSELSARTAAAHTGALVGDDATVDAIFRSLGVIRVDSIEDMMITAGAAASLGPLARPGIGVVSLSGGACDIIADRAEDIGAWLPALAPETEATLRERMPSYGTVQNPLDVTGAAVVDPSLFTDAIIAMSNDPGIGVVAAVASLPWLPSEQGYSAQFIVDAIGAGMRQAAVPCAYVNQVLQPVSETTREVLDRAQVSVVIPGLRQAVVALRGVAWWSEAVTRARATDVGAAPIASLDIPAAQRVGSWSEHRVRRLLADAGIPIVPAVLATEPEAAAKAAAQVGGPVALKICSAQIMHKSDVGGVRLGVADADVPQVFLEVLVAVDGLADADIEGVLVSPMRYGGIELLVGVVRDPQWGPMLAVAVGGVFVEVLKDSVLAPLPIDAGQARAMLESLRAAPMFEGLRGNKPADLDALADVVARVGALAVALGDDLESLEINPLRVDGSTVEALDAVLTWKEH